jgi:septal ring factor EnvC (AmiA/AmiB activator)
MTIPLDEIALMKALNTRSKTTLRLLVVSILATNFFPAVSIVTAHDSKKAVRPTEQEEKPSHSSRSEVPKTTSVSKTKIERLKSEIEQTNAQIKELDLQIAKQEKLKRSIPRSTTTKTGYASEEGGQRAKQLEKSIADARSRKKAAIVRRTRLDDSVAAQGVRSMGNSKQ